MYESLLEWHQVSYCGALLGLKERTRTPASPSSPSCTRVGRSDHSDEPLVHLLHLTLPLPRHQTALYLPNAEFNLINPLPQPFDRTQFHLLE